MSTRLPPASSKRMSDAVARVHARLRRAVGALRAAGVPHAIVGGHAVAAWVSRVDEAAVRNTRDVDILLRRADLPAATAALEPAGFVHRHAASLGRAGRLDLFLDGPGGRARDAIHVVYASEKTAPESPVPNADVTQVEEGGEFPLIALDALVLMKLASWRDKDRVHLRDLAGVGLVDASWLGRVPGELRVRLQHILDTPEA